VARTGSATSWIAAASSATGYPELLAAAVTIGLGECFYTCALMPLGLSAPATFLGTAAVAIAAGASMLTLGAGYPPLRD
jgi:hypothetical protein